MSEPSLFGSDDFAGATFDATRRYRYVLWRRWGSRTSRVLFVMLNPSTADEHVLDPTVRKCVRWAQSWGFGAVDVCNVFAWRSTDPKLLYTLDDPVGPENDHWIQQTAMMAAMVVVAWGKHGALKGRAAAVAQMLEKHKPYCLGVNADGSPEHPLYIANAMKPVPWRTPSLASQTRRASV
jgi:hypothetical protein